MTTNSLTAAARVRRMDRRACLGHAFTVAAAALAWPAAGRAQQKMPKATAQYQDEPRGDERCAGCRYFIEGGSCRLVQGEISPDGWCTLFQPAA